MFLLELYQGQVKEILLQCLCGQGPLPKIPRKHLSQQLPQIGLSGTRRKNTTGAPAKVVCIDQPFEVPMERAGIRIVCKQAMTKIQMSISVVVTLAVASGARVLIGPIFVAVPDCPCTFHQKLQDRLWEFDDMITIFFPVMSQLM